MVDPEISPTVIGIKPAPCDKGEKQTVILSTRANPGCLKMNMKQDCCVGLPILSATDLH